MSWRPACRLAVLDNVLTTACRLCFKWRSGTARFLNLVSKAPLVAFPRAAVWTRRAAVLCRRRAAAG